MKEELESFQDIFGQDILPGHIVALSCANRSIFQGLAVVLSFGYRYSDKAKFVKLIISHDHYFISHDHYSPPSMALSKRWMSVNYGFNNNVIVIEPDKVFLALNNRRIQSLIEAIDLAKDEGILPDDYILGKAFDNKQDLLEIT